MAKKIEKGPSPKKNVLTIGMRLDKETRALVIEACRAISTDGRKITPSQLFATAGLEEAIGLGFSTTMLVEKPRAIHGRWRNSPDPIAPGSGGRQPNVMGMTLNVLHYHPIHAAADWLNVSDQLFLVGSLYGWLAKRMQAEPGNRRLQALRLPDKYQSR